MKFDDIKCFVVRQERYKKDILVWVPHSATIYPEKHLSLAQLIDWDKPEPYIVTENPWLISCYDRLEVAILNGEGKWAHPDCQTYGASVNQIMLVVLDTKNTVPNGPMNVMESIRKMPLTTLDEIEDAKNASRGLGDSVEKVLLFNTLIHKEKEITGE